MTEQTPAEPATEPTSSVDATEQDPDADPQMLNPRDTLGDSDSTGDPDGDPDMLNPRDDLPHP